MSSNPFRTLRQVPLCLALLVFGAAVAPLRAQDAALPRMTNNAILVGFDGAHRDHVKALLKAGKLPNLQKLVDAGALVDIDVTSGATDTKAGWTQILSGYKPQTSGVFSNGKFRDLPEGYSVFERLNACFGKTNIATVAVIGKKAHCGEIDAPYKIPYDQAGNQIAKEDKAENSKPQPGARKGNRGHVVEEGGSKYLVFEGSPYYTMHKNVNEWLFGLMQDARVGDKALEMLEKYGRRPFFFFVHFAEVDHAGHGHGEKSPEYDNAIISGDTQLGRILDKLTELGLREKTLIYATADHGFDIDRTGHGLAPYVWLATNDRQVMRNGARADITPTILSRLGVDAPGLQPALDGETLTRPATKPPEPVVGPKPKAQRKKADGKP